MIRNKQLVCLFFMLLSIAFILIFQVDIKLSETTEDQLSSTELAQDSTHVKIPDGTNLTSDILPKKVYSVIGLESSGTKFVTRIIRDALNHSFFREGVAPYEYPQYDNSDTQVQHFSLPWGSSCVAEPHVPVLDVALPSQCYRKENRHDDCGRFAHELWGINLNGSKAPHPPRFNLDISYHKEWYDAHGVEQYFIIVVRDQNISRKARFKDHCQDRMLLLEEEEVGINIIVDAINKYILETEDIEKMVTPENYTFWKPGISEGHRKLTSSSLEGTLIPHNNNVVLVSYESLMLLKNAYVKVLLKTLGIESDHVPMIKDGNARYVSGEVPRQTAIKRTWKKNHKVKRVYDRKKDLKHVPPPH